MAFFAYLSNEIMQCETYISEEEMNTISAVTLWRNNRAWCSFTDQTRHINSNFSTSSSEIERS